MVSRLNLRLRHLVAAAWLGALLALAAAAHCEPLRVALYCEPGCTGARSREGAWKILRETADFRSERITSKTICSGRLANYDVVVFPGGKGNALATSLGPEGGRALERYVQQGHGVIGICAGGYMIVEGWNPATRAIELVNAKSWDSRHWKRGEGFIAVKLVGADDASSSRTIWYKNGPIFVPGKTAYLPPYTPLARYETDLAARSAPKGMMRGRDAVVATSFGKGRVVAFGPHPELSPELSHWLTNAVRWASQKDDGSSPTVEKVLEGR